VSVKTKERPILFNGEMIRAILDGRKTQTRRVMKDWQIPKLNNTWDTQFPDMKYSAIAQKHSKWGFCEFGATLEECADRMSNHSPYGFEGDHLWVRETFITGWPAVDGVVLSCDEGGNELPEHIWYRADRDKQNYQGWISDKGSRITGWTDENECFKDNIPWKPSIHMPRLASRINLKVKSIRIEQVQDICEEDAKSEGIYDGGCCSCGESSYPNPCGCDNPDPSFTDAFAWLWNSINEKRGYGWMHNPWVWVIEFGLLTESNDE